MAATVITKPKGIVHLSKVARKKNVCIYGDPGIGKTDLLGSYGPQLLLLNADRADGPDSIREHYPEDQWPSMMNVTRMTQLDNVLTYTRRLAQQRNPEFTAVALDSGTIWQENHMDDVMKEMLKTAKHRDPDIPDRPEYQKTQRQLMGWIRHMSRVPRIHFILTAHVLRTEDVDGEVTYKPAIHGQKGTMADRVCGFMSIVGYLKVSRSKRGGYVRVLQLQRDEKHYAKGPRSLGERVVRPDLSTIISVNSSTRKEQ